MAKIILDEQAQAKVQKVLQSFPISHLSLVEELIQIINDGVEKVEESVPEEVD